MAFSHQGHHLASQDSSGIHIYKINTGTTLAINAPHHFSATSLSFSHDGLRLASSSVYEVKIWSTSTGKCLAICVDPFLGTGALAFSQDGDRLTSVTHDGDVKIWDTASGICLQSAHCFGIYAEELMFSHDGQKLATVISGRLQIWDVRLAVAGPSNIRKKKDSVNVVSVLNNGQTLLTVSYDTAKFWDVASGDCLHTYEGDFLRCRRPFTLDRQVASGSRKNVIVWDIVDINPDTSYEPTILAGHEVSITCVALSLTGQKAVSADMKGVVKLWNVKSGGCLATFKLDSARSSVLSFATPLAFSPDEELVACGNQKTTNIWCASSGNGLVSLEGHQESVSSLSFSFDGQKVASGSRDSTIKLWDIKSAECLSSFVGHMGTVTSVAFSSDGKQIASYAEDPCFKIWDTSTRNCVKIWDISTRNCVKSFFVGKFIYRLSFNPHSTTQLVTDAGALEWTSLAISKPSQPMDCLQSLPQYGISRGHGWILHHGMKVLWIPPNFRPQEYAVEGSTLYIGSQSGQVWWVTIKLD